MSLRAYDRERDWEAAQRIYREVGWLGDGPDEARATALAVEAGRAMVAELNGEAECLVLTMPATLRYLDEDLPLSAVTDVVTSQVARRQHLASRVLASSLARDAAQGALVAELGVFDQGYYDRLGFGAGCYEDYVTFDPARLTVSSDHRAPVRVTADDWWQVHAARLARRRRHGGVNLMVGSFTQAMMLGSKQPWGLGYRDGPGDALSHCLWGGIKERHHGPYRVNWLAYQTPEQFRELMAVLKSLGDQVHAVSMVEPPDVQLQDLVDKPLKHLRITERSPYFAHIGSGAWWQVRILDLVGCLVRTRLPGRALRFNLALSDPVTRFLGDDASWRGVAGEYVVALGDPSSAEPGRSAALPILEATVNAFSRLWLGVRSASGLACTDHLRGPEALLTELDRAFCLPEPKRGWSF